MFSLISLISQLIDQPYILDYWHYNSVPTLLVNEVIALGSKNQFKGGKPYGKNITVTDKVLKMNKHTEK